MLADRLRKELSYEAYTQLAGAGIWIDQARTAPEPQIEEALRLLRFEVSALHVECERMLGGAIAPDGTVYGILNAAHSGLMPEADWCRVTCGGPLVVSCASGRLLKQPASGLSFVQYDDPIHHLEVEYLLSPMVARHTVSFPHLCGAALGSTFALDSFAPACGGRIKAWRGYDSLGNLMGAIQLKPHETDELDKEWSSGFTALMTESPDAVVAALDWAERNKYLARWSGPKRQPKKSQRLAVRYLMPQWTDAWRTEVEVSVWGSPGNYCITREGGREW